MKRRSGNRDRQYKHAWMDVETTLKATCDWLNIQKQTSRKTRPACSVDVALWHETAAQCQPCPRGGGAPRLSEAQLSRLCQLSLKLAA